MRSTTIRDLLAAQPVLAGLEAGDLDLMAGCGRNRVVEVGAFLARRGRAGRPVLRAAGRPGRAGDRLADRARWSSRRSAPASSSAGRGSSRPIAGCTTSRCSKRRT